MTGHRRSKGRQIKAVRGINNAHRAFLARMSAADSATQRMYAVADRFASSLKRADAELADSAADEICAAMLDAAFRLDSATIAKAAEKSYRA